MTKRREYISKKTRFEVFKRDGFKCQYCGKSAPDVILHLDHIVPVCKGGGSDILNLVTSCADCNQGKSGRELSDSTVVAKQIKQLQETNEKREQLEMLANWRSSLIDVELQKRDIIVSEISKRYGVPTLNETAKGEIASWVSKYTMPDIFSAIDKAFAQESMPPGVRFDLIGKFLVASKYSPEQQKLFYYRGILKNRLEGRYYDHKLAIISMTDCYRAGVSLEDIESLVRNVECWQDFKEGLNYLKTS